MNLFFIFGTPSALTNWLIHVTIMALSYEFGGYEFAEIIDLTGLKDYINKVSGLDKPVIIYSSHPRKELTELISKLDLTHPIVIENPERVANYVYHSRQLDIRNAIRFTSQSISTLYELSRVCKTNLFSDEIYNMTVQSVLISYLWMIFPYKKTDEIEASYEQIKINLNLWDETLVCEIIETTKEEGNVKQSQTDYLFEKDNLINISLIGYKNFFKLNPGMEFNWPTELIYDHSNLAEIMRGPRPLLGPARILFGGHTMHLPRGKWIATIFIEISDNLSGNVLVSEAYVGEIIYDRVKATLPADGLFSYDVTLTIVDSFDPISIIIAISEGAIEGNILIKSVMIRREDPLY